MLLTFAILAGRPRGYQAIWHPKHPNAQNALEAGSSCTSWHCMQVKSSTPCWRPASQRRASRTQHQDTALANNKKMAPEHAVSRSRQLRRANACC